MSNFKKIAQDTTLLSPIMSGKEKLATEEVVEKKLTVIAFDFAPKFDKEGNRIFDENTGELDEFGVVVFKEFPNSYYCVGTVFTKICKAWAADFETPADASIALEESGGVEVIFHETRTKKGNNLVSVEIL